MAKRANINDIQLEKLLKSLLLQIDDKTTFFIPNWSKWQNPKAKYEKDLLKDDKKLLKDLEAVAVHSSEQETKHAPKGALKDNGFADSGLTEEQFKKDYPEVYNRIKPLKPIEIDF